MNNTFFENYLQGHLPDAYKYFGVHKMVVDGVEGYFFRLYAPMAKEVQVIGDFNDWEGIAMEKVDIGGLWEVFIPGVKEGQRYKFHIWGCDNYWKDKQDPFGFADELKEQTCSYVVDINKIKVDDEEWVSKRERNFSKPVSIYEFHMGTWKRKSDNTY